MPNLDFVTDRLATGGDLPYRSTDAQNDIAAWRRLGITHVIDNRGEWSDFDLVAVEAPEIRYLENGVEDAGQRMPDEWFDRGVDFALAAFRNDLDSKVFVHCHMGINRGPSLAYAILLAEGWDPVEAMDAVRSARPIAGMSYAEDALDWHHRRQTIPAVQRRTDQHRIESWRKRNWIDVVRIIRSIRATEDAAMASPSPSAM